MREVKYIAFVGYSKQCLKLLKKCKRQGTFVRGTAYIKHPVRKSFYQRKACQGSELYMILPTCSAKPNTFFFSLVVMWPHHNHTLPGMCVYMYVLTKSKFCNSANCMVYSTTVPKINSDSCYFSLLIS